MNLNEFLLIPYCKIRQQFAFELQTIKYELNDGMTIIKHQDKRIR